jgi:ribosomal protein S12 methylthiotransferase
MGRLFSLVNLGCPKNTVDSEGLLGSMALAGFDFVPSPELADVCIVNTCGFLDASRREASEVLDELAGERGRRKRPLLVATGCLVERAGGAGELGRFLERADARVGFADYPRLPAICEALLKGEDGAEMAGGGYAGKALPPEYLAFLDRPRMRIGAEHTAYLKIGEGCSNRCAYCSIPLIRGQRASRSMGSILREARQLVDSGAVELNLIAQDTTAYGVDTAGRPQLAALLRELLKMPEDVWIRVLYAHPKHLDEEVLGTMASDPRICPYLDLPLQHVSERMLAAMGRGYGRARVEEALGWLRGALPGAALRTTFIVGHPGESERDFEELLGFVEEGHFDHVGVFAWSAEPGTRSEKMSERVDAAVAEERRERLMRAQGKVSAARMAGRVGARTTLLLERRERGRWVGRTPWQAPEVDGETRLKGPRGKWREGDRVGIAIERAERYDCWAALAET